MSLLVTCARHFEEDADREIREILREFGGENSGVIISDMSGILMVNTELDVFEIIRKATEKISNEPWSIRYCLRIIPIQIIAPTEIEEIVKGVLELKSVIKENHTYRITIEKRNSEISSKDLITAIAEKFQNKVSLENPDYVILIENVGEKTGISILKNYEILRVEKIKRSLSE